MILVLPIGHERQTVQRLPWVTFTLIAINVLVYILMLLHTSDEGAIGEKAQKLSDYLFAHPYLEMPAEMQPFLGPGDKEALEARRESFDQSTLSPETKHAEQE